MEEITIKAQPRTVTGKQVRQLRRDGLVPAVIYGHRTEPIAVQIDERDLRNLLQRAGGTQLIRLQVGNGDKTRMVLLREVQREPIKRRALHVDFLEVVMTERIRADIPVVLVGESPVVQRGDGLLYRGIETVAVECLPTDLIPHIELDVSQLTALDQEVTIGDLGLGEQLGVLSDPTEVLARVIAVQAEEVEAEAEAEAEVEVISHEQPAEGEAGAE